jgi:hypothetical protein
MTTIVLGASRTWLDAFVYELPSFLEVQELFVASSMFPYCGTRQNIKKVDVCDENGVCLYTLEHMHLQVFYNDKEGFFIPIDCKSAKKRTLCVHVDDLKLCPNVVVKFGFKESAFHHVAKMQSLFLNDPLINRVTITFDFIPTKIICDSKDVKIFYIENATINQLNVPPPHEDRSGTTYFLPSVGCSKFEFIFGKKTSTHVSAIYEDDLTTKFEHLVQAAITLASNQPLFVGEGYPSLRYYRENIRCIQVAGKMNELETTHLASTLQITYAQCKELLLERDVFYLN